MERKATDRGLWGCPASEAELTAFQTPVRAFAQSCIDLSTPPGIVQFVSTNEVIQDWDQVRAALGYDVMHHFGISYGTYYGAKYAHAFPEHVGRFVLDAVFPPNVSNVDLLSKQYAALDRSLTRSDVYCLNDTTCPFHSQGKGAVLEAFQNVMDLAGSGSPATSGVSAADVRFFAGINYIAGDPNFPLFNTALFEALQGNWSLFNYTTAGPIFTGAAGSLATTYCLDYHVDDNTFEGYANILKVGAESDPLGAQFLFFLILHLLCTAWPYHAASNPAVPVNASMVLVTADFDYTTPTELATFEWMQQANNSVLVVRHGDDHGTYNVPGPARDAFINFLATGTLPAPVNETFVTVYEPGSVRAPVPDPYSVPVGVEAGDMDE
ncbi:hypothetical protein FB45DRAFT_1149088 [Roridomyces roridus]|uniref:Peptidase S33 tripeptidyl aminopeptidase-like C-terminal domain-containing protein n=1 Tax=Roridomyces roridus TaxID=1738132 RepID=A0AAD7AZR4_9AGAR|nr:hypothetical protein FB45DRAFT_1149088 [Roridomyces roridus]